MSVVVVSVDGDGGGCFVSSCRWCAMFLNNNNRDATLMCDTDFFISFFFGSSSILLPSLCDRTTSQLWKELQGLVCVFAEDFEDVRKCQKVNESGDRTMLLVISACLLMGKNTKRRSELVAK